MTTLCEHSMWEHSICEHSTCEHSMFDHSICETTLCVHSMGALYVRIVRELPPKMNISSWAGCCRTPKSTKITTKNKH